MLKYRLEWLQQVLNGAYVEPGKWRMSVREGPCTKVRKSRYYTAAQAVAVSGRCRLCDAKELHGEGECGLLNSLVTPDELEPSTAWRRGLQGRARYICHLIHRISDPRYLT